MGEADWSAPRTEEGLQTVLRRLAESRAVSDQIEIGHGLLELSFLVKWVRSDTPQPPFVRSHELALQALEVFRHAGDRDGVMRSLVAASAMADAAARESLLSEAETLAESVGDENGVAMVLAAKARGLAMSDREGATELHRRALETYRRTGHQEGQARCLFGLAIGSGTSEDKRDFAREAARLFRELGEPAEASRCVMIALMNAEETEPLSGLEELAQEGLQDALSAGKQGQEGQFYGKLALIAISKGQHEEAAKYRQWATDIEAAEGLTPRERWQNDVEMIKTMITMTRAQGHKEAAKTFRGELKRLMASKPDPNL